MRIIQVKAGEKKSFVPLIQCVNISDNGTNIRDISFFDAVCQSQHFVCNENKPSAILVFDIYLDYILCQYNLAGTSIPFNPSILLVWVCLPNFVLFCLVC